MGLHILEVQNTVLDMQNPEYTKAVAAEVRAALARAKISPSALAHHLHMSRPTVTRRLSGEVAFSIDELFSVATLVDRPIADFIDIEPPMADAS